MLLEAAGHVGGRCITDNRTFGVPYDRGAHWIHTPELNPVAKLAPHRGIDIYPAPPSQKVRIGRRYAREGELEDFLAIQVKANRAIADLARKGDVACAQALPNDLGDWRPLVEFVLGPFGCAKELTQVSAADFAKSAERNTDVFCRQGFGKLIASLADGIAVRLSTPVTSIDTRRGLMVETPKGTISAHAAIVTVSTNVTTSGAIKFTPELSKRQLDAFANLSLGSYDHVALELAGNPLDADSDDLIFEKAAGERTAAILANVSGTPLCLVEVAGSFGRELAEHGEAAMVDFAADWLAGLLRLGGEKGHQAFARHALEQRTVGAWRLFGRGAGMAGCAAHPDGAGPERSLVRRRSRPRNVVGHCRRCLGIGRTRRRRDFASAWAGQRAGAAGAAPHRNHDEDLRHRRITSGGRSTAAHARSTPPVRLPTSATIFAASASISASVMVLSRG